MTFQNYFFSNNFFLFFKPFCFPGHKEDEDLDSKKLSGDKKKDLDYSIQNSLTLREKSSEDIKNNLGNVSSQTSDGSINNKIEGTNLTSEILKNEIDSVALDWKTLRNIEECSCTTPFDHSTRKVRY